MVRESFYIPACETILINIRRCMFQVTYFRNKTRDVKIKVTRASRA